MSQIMADKMGRRTRVPADHPALFRNENIKRYACSCWHGQISLAETVASGKTSRNESNTPLTQREGNEVVPFVLTYHRHMTRKLGYAKQVGYEFWQVFAELALQLFSLTQDVEKALREMRLVRYRRDITKLLVAMENLNIDGRVTGIAWRKMIEEEIPEDPLKPLSLRECVDDGKWLEAVRIVIEVEGEFKE